MVNGVNKEATLFGNCKNEKVVSVCCSARSTPVAAEASVETLAEFQGNGYGTDGVTAWAISIKEEKAFHFIVLLGIIMLHKPLREN